MRSPASERGGCGGTATKRPWVNSKIGQPAHAAVHPRVLIDAAHHNVFSTTTNRIDPLVTLLRADGLVVDTSPDSFTARSLASADILVVLTANGGAKVADPAFTAEEIEAVYTWVHRGGAMLFCLDHYSFGQSGTPLAERFGVQVFLGYVEDAVTSDRWAGDNRTPVYSRANGGLSDHPITGGRDSAERLERVGVFDGESLKGPLGSIALFRVAESAVNGGDDLGRPGEDLGPAQAVALQPGQGRVVITADCSMWPAQLVRVGAADFRYGMARKDLDIRQFA